MSANMSEALLPCPAGHEVDDSECPYPTNRAHDEYEIVCTAVHCGWSVIEATPEKAIASWNHRRAQSAELASLRAEVARCHARLEIDHLFTCGGKPEDGGFLRVEVPMDERRDVPDGITCRDATIDGQDEVIASLRARCDAAEKDAERYRWIRDQNCVAWHKGACVVNFNIGHDWIEYGDAEGLDGHIDTALTAERAKEGETK